MIGARIQGLDLPDAQATPSGMPDVSCDTYEAANGQLLWRTMRETVSHSDQPIRSETRNGVLGWLWRGNPRDVAEAMWDGLDRSELASETLAALYAYLHRVGQLTRTDIGNKGREWWVADKWDPDSRRVTHEEALHRHAETELRRVAEPGALHEDVPGPARLTGRLVMEGASKEFYGHPETKPDYAAVLQGLIDEVRALRAEHQRILAKASLAGGTMEDLSDEIIQLRGMNEELRAANKRLREENTAYRVILDQPDDE